LGNTSAPQLVINKSTKEAFLFRRKIYEL